MSTEINFERISLLKFTYPENLSKNDIDFPVDAPYNLFFKREDLINNKEKKLLPIFLKSIWRVYELPKIVDQKDLIKQIGINGQNNDKSQTAQLEISLLGCEINYL